MFLHEIERSRAAWPAVPGGFGATRPQARLESLQSCARRSTASGRLSCWWNREQDHCLGQFSSGVRDLGSSKKHLKGFGRWNQVCWAPGSLWRCLTAARNSTSSVRQPFTMALPLVILRRCYRGELLFCCAIRRKLLKQSWRMWREESSRLLSNLPAPGRECNALF